MKAEIEIGMTAVEKAMGTAPAPFFRFPYLSESKAAIAYLQSRNIAMLATDIDSLDWRTRSPQTVTQRVMALLKQRGRGIILFHDIHGSTAAALPTLLLQLKAKGFKVVHLKPKAPVQTLAEYQPPAKDAAAHGATEPRPASDVRVRSYRHRRSHRTS
jgi:peptidoglycan-N-acetylglucosamine deacetylase